MMILLAFLLSCSDMSINEIKQPELIVAPSTLDFGHLLSGNQTRLRTITIANGGTDVLKVDRIKIEGERYSGDESGFEVESGSYYQIEITYAPSTFEHNEGHVDIWLEGDEQPSAGVWLDGYGDAPLINITPSNHDFGTPLLGCDMTQEIIVENNGNVDLQIDDFNLMTTVPAEIHLDFGTLPSFPWIIPPSGRLVFYSNYSPIDLINDLVTIDVTSNDPANPLYNMTIKGSGVLSNETRQRWVQRNEVIVDIVWVIDNSGSMAPFQNLLGLNIEFFMNIFLSYSPNYQMAFITTDSPNFVGYVIDSNSIDPLGDSISIINSIGHGGSGMERGLDMLKRCMEINDCSSFMRPNATLIAIFLSDEKDNSSNTINYYISYFDLLSPNGFIPYGIIGDVPDGCYNHPLSGDPGLGYWEVINHYGSKWWSICDENWGDQLEEVAQNISLMFTFPLDNPDPFIDSIKVWVNGQMVATGWSYNEDSNSVVFDLDSVPEQGDTIEITYSTWSCE